MLFNSFAFLVFLPLFVLIYFSTRGKSRLWICLGASYLFYSWWDWRFLGLILFSTVLDYSVGLQLGCTKNERHRKLLLFTSLAANLGLLGVFKYFNFFIDSFIDAANVIGIGLDAPLLNVVLPVGISFYTFQTLSYTLDLYWRRIDVEREFVRFATFVAFFPQLVAGPIIRASHLLPQLRRDQRFVASAFYSGVQLMLWGFFKKVVVADSLATVIDPRFGAPQLHGTLSLSIGLFFYAFQIYCDFSGYSDIAIGTARILGFDFGMNFNKPYFARSFSEFWERWHISLSRWLRDYLYIPLGGNRSGKLPMYRNLMVVMLLGGLWHGANWTFVVWGGLHGAYLILQRTCGPAYRRVSAGLRLPLVVRGGIAMFVVFMLTCLAWIFFRAPSVTDAMWITERIFGLSALGDTAVPMAFEVARGFGVIGLLLTFELLTELPNVQIALKRSPGLQLAASAAALLAIALLGTFTGNRFIYFQF